MYIGKGLQIKVDTKVYAVMLGGHLKYKNSSKLSNNFKYFVELKANIHFILFQMTTPIVQTRHWLTPPF